MQLHDHLKHNAWYEVRAYNVIYLVYILILLEAPNTNKVDWHTYMRSMVFFPHVFRGLVLIGREQPHYCRCLSAPGAVYTSPATCYSTRPVGHYHRKNREYYSILTHCIMECLAGPYNGKTTVNYEYM